MKNSRLYNGHSLASPEMDFVEVIWKAGSIEERLPERLACVCAIPHWFDESIAGVLAERELDGALERLAAKYPSFVRKHPRGYTYHESIRQAFWDKWHQSNPDQLRQLSAALVDYYDQAIDTLSPAGRLDYEYERMYHLTTIDPGRGFQVLDNLFQTAQDNYKIEACHWLVDLIDEHGDYLPINYRLQLRYYRGELARELHQSESAEFIFLEILEHPDTDDLTRAKANNSVALSIISRGARLDDALPYLLKSIEILRETENWHWLGKALYNLAYVYRLAGRRENALRYGEEALAVVEEHKEEDSVAWLIRKSRILSEIGQVHWLLGEPPRAATRLLEALDIQLQVGADDAASETYANLSRLERTSGNWDQAIDYLQHSIQLATETGNQHQLAWAKNALGNVYVEMQDWENAHKCFEESLQIWESIHRKHEQGVPLKNLIGVYIALGKWELAEKCAQESLLIFAEHESRQGEIYNSLGQLRLAQGQFDQAQSDFDQALVHATEHSDRKTETHILVNLAKLNLQRGYWEQARRYGKQAVQLGCSYQQLNRVAQANLVLGEVSLREGYIEQAASELVEACRNARAFNPKTYELTLSKVADLVRRLRLAGSETQIDWPSFSEHLKRLDLAIYNEITARGRGYL